ncbi:MAG: class I SAM-dependent methyltransferase [Acidimicrobiia bacterium]
MTDATVESNAGRDATGDARSYDAWFDSPWGRYAWAEESRLLHAALEGSGGRRGLDVGCGTGRSSALLREHASYVVGIDPDPGMLGLGRAHVDAAILATGERLPFSDHAFETTVAVTVLEFVRTPAEVVADMVRVTRSPGRIVIGALNPRSPWGLWHRRELHTGPWRTARFLTGQDLARLGRAHGRVTLDQGLHAPGRLPGLARWGPAVERVGRRLRVPGAFCVLTIERR